ncbi:adenine phosphoribosyltransferase [Bifidobacterium sp. ESL0745]|uniref:adenine phosphoribosyltransferase n=1 Tax=Bifidobacterium sp. ESL0745 TaxID=2983226 RepID=UPI0023F857C8|nr:adenine phosphoribosyltransferase [Bifidobacterium sp. ESL0745]MDF7665053.1 adenine phosphoribosyltransferase [Bifidobacterium sp. ESL0745]
MTQSDITITELGKVGEEDAEYVVSLIRTIPGFPKEGVLFRDFIPVLADPRGFSIMMKALELALPVSADSFDYVAGLEARGFLIGPPLAAQMGKGFLSVRKAGKLPPETIGESYSLEYGEATVEMEKDAIKPGDKVLIVDDLIATGGTAKAAADLIEKAGGKVVGFSFVMELIGLSGRSDLAGVPISSLVTMPA